MKVKNVRTGKERVAIILPLIIADYNWITYTGNYTFDWTQEAGREVYKLVLEKSNDEMRFIHGLLSFEAIPKEQRIHIHLLESAIINRGKNKKWKHVAGCLLAYAAQQSFARGYQGFVSLRAKSELVDWYIQQYGFQLVLPKPYCLLIIEGKNAVSLIEKYLS